MSSIHFVILAVVLTMSLDTGLSLNLTGLETDRWWGPAELNGTTDEEIYNFTIVWEADMITDLQTRLKNRRDAKPPLDGAGFTYGFNSSCTQEWTDYWADEYPFEEREAYFNKHPMYKTNIQGLDIQFVWVKPDIPEDVVVDVIPLLILHGWPGSSREFYEAIPLLTAYNCSRSFAVEVVVPQLPGFGYSDATSYQGLGAAEMGVIMRNLMRRLGHETFYIQGGDFGSITASYMVTVFPDEILGFHTNFPVSILPGFLVQFLGSGLQNLLVDSDYIGRLYPSSVVLSGLLEQTGYLHEQATKPDTLGLGMADSPTALLTYVLEKMPVSKDPELLTLPDGGLSTFDKIPILDLLMNFWAPNSMTTAMRIYAETFNKRNFIRGLDWDATTVPTWALQSVHEMVYQPESILKLKYTNLLKAEALDYGGHFFALDYPEEYSEDVLKALTAFIAFNADKSAYCAANPPTITQAIKDGAAQALSNFIINSNISSFLEDYIHITV